MYLSAPLPPKDDIRRFPTTLTMLLKKQMEVFFTTAFLNKIPVSMAAIPLLPAILLLYRVTHGRRDGEDVSSVRTRLPAPAVFVLSLSPNMVYFTRAYYGRAFIPSQAAYSYRDDLPVRTLPPSSTLTLTLATSARLVRAVITAALLERAASISHDVFIS